MTRIPETVGWRATGTTLGEGGQGTVIEVVRRDGPADQVYAMKVLRAGQSTAAYERFAREQDVLSRLNSPYIAHIVDHSKLGDSFHYYVMERFTGARSLQKLLGTEKNPFANDPRTAVEFFFQLSSAIGAYKASSVVHRDLSPGNVLVLADSSIRLIDFGICQIQDNSPITLLDENLGTRNYAAPECEAGSRYPITVRSDLYSAGKLLWAAVTNRPVFAREAPAFGTHSLKSVLPSNHLAWHLQRLIARTIRGNPGDRFGTPDEALEESLHVRRLIDSRRFPIELVTVACPICGYGALNPTRGLHAFFANPQVDGYQNMQCGVCGYTAVVNAGIHQASVGALYPGDEA